MEDSGYSHRIRGTFSGCMIFSLQSTFSSSIISPLHSELTMDISYCQLVAHWWDSTQVRQTGPRRSRARKSLEDTASQLLGGLPSSSWTVRAGSIYRLPNSSLPVLPSHLLQTTIYSQHTKRDGGAARIQQLHASSPRHPRRSFARLSCVL